MPRVRLDQARPFFALGLVVIAWLLVPLVVKRLLHTSFFEVQAPLPVAASYARDLQDYWALRTRSRNELIERIRELGHANSALENSVRQFETTRAELSRLETLLRLPSWPEYRSEPARVVRRDFTTWWHRLIIRKGKNAGLSVGAPVIFSGGVVGRVSEVHAYTATVDLISSQTVRLAATLEGDTRPVSFQGGNNAPFTTPRGTVEFVPLDVSADDRAPKRLVTSGLGGIFPPGLALGVVDRLEPSTDGLFKSGRVTLDQRLLAVTEVTVLVPLAPTDAPPAP